ncbi:MAG TPA: alpha/beta hydrolase [Candidatus Limnocylindrales bacterium]|nr:alpha/beta hydrolase [Candidatus Limnocylindrales bacterium]
MPGPFGDVPAFEAVSRDGVPLALFEVLPVTGADDSAEPASSTLAAETGSGGSTGAARPPALLLVHGATADHTTWRTAGPAFAERRRVLAIDRRGRGASGDGQAYAIEREYEDVAAAAEAIVDATGAPIDVVGHSYGGRVSLGASLRSRAIRRLVVYEGAPVPAGMSYRPPGMVEAVRGALDRGDNEAALATFLAGIVGMSEAALDAYRADPVWPTRVAAAPTILREVEAEGSAAASLDALGGVTAPVLLLLGSISRSPFRIGTDELAARLADVRVVTITGAAHAAHHTHAADFVRAVEAFLDEGAR